MTLPTFSRDALNQLSYILEISFSISFLLFHDLISFSRFRASFFVLNFS